MEYRLLEDLAGVGSAGQVFNSKTFNTIPFYNKPLFEPIQDESYYLYVLRKIHGQVELKFLLTSVIEVMRITERLKNVDDWVKSGVMTAASEHRPYKYNKDSLSLTLQINHEN